MTEHPLSFAVQAASPEDEIDVASLLADVTLPPPPPPLGAGPAFAGPSFDPAPEPLAQSNVISLDLFQTRFALMHDMVGGMVQARSGTPCPLGQQARSEGGIAAGAAFYSICETSPLLASWFLTEEMSFVGKVLAIGMHGFACVQVVKASTAAADQGPAFQSRRSDQEAA